MNPRKPTQVKILQGTFRKDRSPKNEPAPVVKAPRRPACLNRVAKTEWKRSIDLLLGMRLLSEIDMALLAGYCENYAIWYQCCGHINRRYGNYALYLEGKNSQTAIHITQARAALQLMVTISAKFGMSPSDRGHLEIRAPEKKKSKMAELLEKR